MIADALKLSVYFGDSATSGSKLASAALMQRMAEREVKVAALFRGVEGFGSHRRIHAGRFPDVSTDLPLLAMAVDERPRIESLLADVDEIVSQGLVTLEYARLATDGDVAEAVFPEAPGRVGKSRSISAAPTGPVASRHSATRSTCCAGSAPRGRSC